MPDGTHQVCPVHGENQCRCCQGHQGNCYIAAAQPHGDGEEPLKYENGWLLFYVENNTDEFLTMNSLDAAVGGEAVDLFLWCDLPPKSRAVVRMDLFGLEKLDFSTPSQLGELEMTVEFWNPDNYSEGVRQYTITMPMINTEPVVIS